MEMKIKTQNAVIKITEQEEFTKIELLNIKNEERIIFYAGDVGIPGVIGPNISFSLDEVLNPIREDALDDATYGKDN